MAARDRGRGRGNDFATYRLTESRYRARKTSFGQTPAAASEHRLISEAGVRCARLWVRAPFEHARSRRAGFCRHPTRRMPLPVATTMRLRRVLRVLLCVRAKHLVRTPFLLIRHRVVQVLESQNELLQMPGVDLRHLLV